MLVDQKHAFELGGVQFEIHHTPGETYDHLAVWLPQFKVAFVGDNFYRSFPNIYTLRGTKPRWALEYVQSLDKIIAWEPEILVPSHGPQVRGKEEIKRRLQKYREAILYVHDQTVAGMNAGKDVYSLMNEIVLPDNLDVGTTYGKISWTVRGIYEGYAGWFDGKPANLYSQPVSTIYPDLVDLAGGSGALVKLARSKISEDQLVKALHITDVALAANPRDSEVLEVQLKILEKLKAQAANSNENGWLSHGIRKVKQQLDILQDNE